MNVTLERVIGVVRESELGRLRLDGSISDSWASR
jgi:hypothetical protein